MLANRQLAVLWRVSNSIVVHVSVVVRTCSQESAQIVPPDYRDDYFQFKYAHFILRRVTCTILFRVDVWRIDTHIHT